MIKATKIHTFVSSQLDVAKCIICKRPEIDHTENAVCEVCPNTGHMNLYIDMLMCDACVAKENTMQTELKDTAEQRVETNNAVLSMNSILTKARSIDLGIQVVTDIFNAETVSIADIKKAIDEDASIEKENKAYKLAEIVKERFEQDSKVIFDAQKVLLDANNRQRAQQSYLNELANKLRSEERERLKLADLSYQPVAPKTVKTRTTSTKKPKFDMAALQLEADKLKAEGINIPATALQMLCVAKNLTPEAAANTFRKNVKEIASENEN